MSACEVVLGELHPLEQQGGVVHEHLALRGEKHPAPAFLQQRHPRLGLEQGQLLGHGGGGVGQRLGDGREGAPDAQLPQQAQAAQVQHPAPSNSKQN